MALNLDDFKPNLEQKRKEYAEYKAHRKLTIDSLDYRLALIESDGTPTAKAFTELRDQAESETG